MVHRAHLSSLCGGTAQNFMSLKDIKCSLPAPAVKFVFSDVSESGSFGIIVKMANAEILLNNITKFGYFFVTFYFIGGQFGGG